MEEDADPTTSSNSTATVANDVTQPGETEGREINSAAEETKLNQNLSTVKTENARPEASNSNRNKNSVSQSSFLV